MTPPTVETLLPEIALSAIHAAGPGGQNVNKVATAIQLRFDVGASKLLPPELVPRLLEVAGRRVSSSGVIVITARRQRTQERNRRDALNRLQALLDEAAAPPPPPRVPTRTPPAVKRRRLQDKRSRSNVKRSRRTPGSDE
jgi:ribosome-associated protein